MAADFAYYPAEASGTGRCAVCRQPHCPRCGQRANFGGGLGERKAIAEPPPARVGSADKRFPGKPGKPEKLGTPVYGSQFRVPSGGSKWNRTLPGAEFGNLNLWFPNSSLEPAAATGCRLSLPAAGGSRPCRPAASACRLGLASPSPSCRCRRGRPPEDPCTDR